MNKKEIKEQKAEQKAEKRQKKLRSINGFNIVKREINDAIYAKYIEERENTFLAELLASRDVKYEDRDFFLQPKLKNLLPHVGILRDTDKAVDRVLQAISNKENICVFGDYDVDGLTSGTMLVLFLRQFCQNVTYYIPNRTTDGYGPNCEIIKKISKNGAKLLICVDCGITAFEPFETAKANGLDVVVLDHHKSADTMPECVACVDPNRIDETEIQSELHNLCACGVSFLFMIALYQRLKYSQKENQRDDKNSKNNELHDDNKTRNRNDVQNIDNTYNNNLQCINLMHFTPLVAFATICDVMSLTRLNRAFVRTGLNVLHKEKSFNLYELFQTATGNDDINQLTAYTFGFLLGPIINAGGRIDDSSLGIEFMLSTNSEKTTILAKKLCDLNNKRKDMEAMAIRETHKQNEKIKKQIKEQGFILLYSKDWHEGIVGLIASRLKEEYSYPTIIGTELENKTIKFSSRSVGDVNIGKIILQAYNKNLLINGGGHKLAGGFTCEISKIEELTKFLKEKIKINSDKNFINKSIMYDIAISLSGINFDLLRKIEDFEPFGVGNPKIVFLLQDVRICSVNVLKDKHISVVLTDGNKSDRVICFNCIGTELGDFLMSSKNKTVCLIVSADINEYNGHERINIIITDAVEQSC